MECTSGVCPPLFVLLGLTLPFAAPYDGPSMQRSGTSLKCHVNNTIPVIGSVIDGGLMALGYRFSEEYYQRINRTHFRVCICKVAKCMRKCCSEGMYLLNKTCVQGSSPPLRPLVYNNDLQLLYYYDYSRFFSVTGDTCDARGWYRLEPPEDTPYFIETGRLVVKSTGFDANYGPEDFCFEHSKESPDERQFNLDIFVCFDDEDDKVVTPFLPIGMIISTPFLLATFLVYSLRELRNLHGKNLMSHVGSLFVAYVALVAVQMESQPYPREVCVALGYIIQYSFLASFFWLNVMCFDIWWAFSGFGALKGEKKSADKNKYILYSAYAWGCPGLITAITLIFQFAPGIPDAILKPDIGDYKCFFTNEKANLAYFYGPTAIVLLSDVVFFILTAVKIITVKKETVAVFRGKDSCRNREASKQRYVMYLKLFLIMGVNWIMEVISWAVEGPRWIWYFTDLANTLQGVLIFSLFVLKPKGLFVFILFVCTRRVKRLLTARFCPHLKKKDADTHTTSTKLSVSRKCSAASTVNNDVIIPMNAVPPRKTSS